MLGLPLGILLCCAVVGAIAQKYGWRMPFFAAAVPGIFVAVIAYFLTEPARGSQEESRSSHKPKIDS